MSAESEPPGSGLSIVVFEDKKQSVTPVPDKTTTDDTKTSHDANQVTMGKLHELMKTVQVPWPELEDMGCVSWPLTKDWNLMASTNNNLIVHSRDDATWVDTSNPRCLTLRPREPDSNQGIAFVKSSSHFSPELLWTLISALKACVWGFKS